MGKTTLSASCQRDMNKTLRNIFNCKLCNSFQDLGQKGKMKKAFKCEDCGKQLSTKWNLKIHYKTCIRDETQEKGTKSEKQDNKHLGGYFSHQGYKWTKHK